MTSKKDPIIKILRVFAMLTIIITHLCQFYNFVALRSLLIGVPLFFLISGYLYGRKNQDIKTFFKSRIKTTYIPTLLYQLFVFLYSIIVLGIIPSILDVIMHFLNLQGINNIFLQIKYYPFSSCSITWFMTIIMFCYFLVPFLQHTRDNKKLERGGKISVIGIVLVVLLTFANIRIHYLWVFIVGYLLSYHYKQIGKKHVFISLLVTALLWGVRIFSRGFIDGTILYDEIIAVFSGDMLAILLLICMKYFGGYSQRFFEIIERVSKNKIINWLDKMSLYIYLTHYLFFKGFWSVTNITSNIILQTILLIVLTIPTSYALLYLSKVVGSWFEKIMESRSRAV